MNFESLIIKLYQKRSNVDAHYLSNMSIMCFKLLVIFFISTNSFCISFTFQHISHGMKHTAPTVIVNTFFRNLLFTSSQMSLEVLDFFSALTQFIRKLFVSLNETDVNWWLIRLYNLFDISIFLINLILRNSVLKITFE